MEPKVLEIENEEQLPNFIGDTNFWQPFQLNAFNSQIVFQKVTDQNDQLVLAYFRLPWGYCLPDPIEKDLIKNNFPDVVIVDMGKEARRRDFELNRNTNGLNTRQYYLHDALWMLNIANIAQSQLKNENIPSITQTPFGFFQNEPRMENDPESTLQPTKKV